MTIKCSPNLDFILKSNLCTQFSMMQKSWDVAVFVLCIKYMQIKHSWCQNSRVDQKCSGMFPNWLEQLHICLANICLSNTPEPLSSNPLVAMTSQVLIASPKCIERIIDSIHLLTNPLLSLFSNAFPAAPVYCHTRSEHFCIPRRRDIQLKDQINHLTTPFRKSYLFADLCCLPAP